MHLPQFWRKRQKKGTSVSTQSKPETTPDYEWHGDRRHLRKDSYMLPKDDREIHRLDFQHYMLRYVFRGNHLSPIVDNANVLDIGCGTGRWIMEMAQEFPQAHFLGIDIDVPETNTLSLSEQAQFQQVDLLQGLPFPDQSFDFVHQRLLLFAIPLSYWPMQLKQIVRVTRIGGWIELLEADPYYLHMGPATERVTELVTQTSMRHGLDTHITRHMFGFLRMQNLKNIHIVSRKVPVGNWGGRLGHIAFTDIHALGLALKPRIVSETGISDAEFEQLLHRMFQEMGVERTTVTFQAVYVQRV